MDITHDPEITELEELAYREMVLTILKEGEAGLDFTKVDGTNRKMRGTLNRQLISELYLIDGVSVGYVPEEPKQNATAQAVFDLDKKEWRAFRWDKLISIAGKARPNVRH